VLVVSDLRMGYGERTLFTDVNLHLTYGERAVLLGPNGVGKTTLLRCITGELQPWAGDIRLGRGVRLGYIAQEQETLDPAAAPFDLLRAAAPLDETEARNFLHYFLFTGDEVFLPAGRLSFGERSRLALALLAAQGCNFLLLDEPINHLDIPSRESFERAMARFEGAILAVVHDRYFIERLATTLWLLADGRVRTAPGPADR
jgi:ATP-binding cassette subfamily F protein 3